MRWGWASNSAGDAPRGSPWIGRPSPRCARELAREEVAHERGDLLASVLEGEVPGVEEMQLGVGEVAQVGARAVGGKDRVVLGAATDSRLS